MTNPIRVLIADDHPMIVEGFIAAFKGRGIDVYASVPATDQILPAYEETRPDVLVLDIRFESKASGLDVLRKLLAVHPEAKVIVYSQFDQIEIVREAYQAGAKAFVTKNGPRDVIAELIRKVHAGAVEFLPEIAERLARHDVLGDDSPRTKLDERELEVFLHVANGRTQAEIVKLLHLSPKTITTVMGEIKRKVGVERPADFARLAGRHKLIEL